MKSKKATKSVRGTHKAKQPRHIHDRMKDDEKKIKRKRKR